MQKCTTYTISEEDIPGVMDEISSNAKSYDHAIQYLNMRSNAYSSPEVKAQLVQKVKELYGKE